MKLVFLMSSLILAASSVVADSTIDEPDDYASIKTESTVLNEKSYLESVLFHNPDSKPIAIEDIQVLELEEDVCLPIEISKYLPKNFNPLKGKNDLDWSKINLIELEETVDLGFDTKDYLPENFNPYKGMIKQSKCLKQ